MARKIVYPVRIEETTYESLGKLATTLGITIADLLRVLILKAVSALPAGVSAETQPLEAKGAQHGAN